MSTMLVALRVHHDVHAVMTATREERNAALAKIRGLLESAVTEPALQEICAAAGLQFHSFGFEAVESHFGRYQTSAKHAEMGLCENTWDADDAEHALEQMVDFECHGSYDPNTDGSARAYLEAQGYSDITVTLDLETPVEIE